MNDNIEDLLRGINNERFLFSLISNLKGVSIGNDQLISLSERYHEIVAQINCYRLKKIK